MDQDATKRSFNEFDEKYGYDSAYLIEAMEASPAGFAKFLQFMPLAEHRQAAPIEALFVANLVATQASDCGSCLQLVARMAREAGLSNEIIQATVSGGDQLPDHLKLIRRYALAVANAEFIDPDLLDAVREQYSDTAITEIAFRIATARVFPTIKRASEQKQINLVSALRRNRINGSSTLSSKRSKTAI